MHGYSTDTQAGASRNTTVPASVTPVELFALGGPVASTVHSLPQAIRGRTILNDSTAELTIVFGTEAELTAGSKSAIIGANGYFEVPYAYIGPIFGRWAAATGNAQLSELY